MFSFDWFKVIFAGKVTVGRIFMLPLDALNSVLVKVLSELFTADIHVALEFNVVLDNVLFSLNRNLRPIELPDNIFFTRIFSELRLNKTPELTLLYALLLYSVLFWEESR